MGATSLTRSGITNFQKYSNMLAGNAIGPVMPASGLQLYLDASNTASYPGTGSIWYDLSGNNRHFTWDNPSFNSGAIKSFYGNSRVATGPASNSFGINNTTGYTLFFTLYQNSLNSSTAFKWFKDGSGTSQTRGIMSHATWADGNLYWDQGGCCDVGQRTSVALPSSTGTWHVIAYRNNYAATSRTIWRNNSILATNSSGISDINLNGNPALIGAKSEPENPNSWDANIGQFVMYNRPLSDAEMATVYNILRVKVGL